MSARERLPDRRGSESFTFELNGLRFTATVSRFADGRVSQGRALGPVGAALDLLLDDDRQGLLFSDEKNR